MANVKKTGKFFLYSIIILGIMFIGSFTISLFKAGFEDPEIFERFIFYSITGGLGYLIIVGGYIYEYIITEDDKKYGNGLAFFSIGEKPAFKFWKRFTAFQLTLLSLIVFTSTFLIASVTRVFFKLSSFTTLPTQQFSPTDALLFSSGLIPIAENLALGSVLVLSIIGLRILARRINMKSSEFTTLSLTAIPVIGMTFWFIWHQSVYPNSETAGLVVGVFGFVMSFLNVSTGFFGIGHIIHLLNNFFIDIARFLSSEAITIGVIIGIILIGVLYFFLYKDRLLGAKNE